MSNPPSPSSPALDSLYPLQGTWDDSQSPAFAFGVGNTVPSLIAFPTGSDLRLYQCDGSDILYWSLQFPHTILPKSITLKPHVHWTMAANPTAGQNLIWKIDYVSSAINGTFQDPQIPLTAPTYVTLGNELRKHKVTAIGNIVITGSPSLIVLGRITCTPPASRNPLLLGFDIHFQRGPLGTDSEFA
jgi:hypothetical protein